MQQLAQSASQTGSAKSIGVLPGGVGYQDMGGRVMRYATAQASKRPPAASTATSR